MHAYRLPLCLALVALGTGASFAQDAGEPASPISGSFDNYVVFDPLTPGITTDHSVTVTVAAPVSGDLTIGGDLTLGVSTDLTVPSADPYWDIVLRAESVVAGTFEALDAGTALGTACVTPAGGSSNFGTEPLTFGTCTGYSDGQSLLYTSPAFGGVTFYGSVMADPFNEIAAGEVDTSVSLALGYEEELGAGTLTGSLGFDKALSLKGGGGPLPTLIQAGANYEVEGWTLGGAGQLELDSLTGGNSWAAGIGVGKEIVENFTLTAELSTGAFEDAGTPTDEYGFGATAEYALIKDVLYIDAGVSVLHSIAGGVDTVTYSAGTGLYFTQSF